MCRCVSVLIICLLPKWAAGVGCAMTPARMRTNNLENPLGVPSSEPRFSWSLEGTTTPLTRGLKQVSYQIQCFSERGGEPDVWDSGKVASGETLQIPYGGRALNSSQKVFWRVTGWDAAGNACPSQFAWFETALLSDADWQGADWLARYPADPNLTACDHYQHSERNKAPRFRTEFKSPNDIVSARAYISGLGYYQLYIDGQRVGTSRLDPGWSSYDHTVLYAVYDVTSQLTTANASLHAIGVELGNGWWNPLPLLFWGHVDIRQALVEGQGRMASEPMFKLHIVATMKDGSTQTLASSKFGGDNAWSTLGSPTTFNNIYLGEAYDARIESATRGWSEVGYDDSQWTNVVLANSSGLGRLEAQSVPPIRRMDVLKTTTVSVKKSAANSTIILDTGRNHAGVCRYRLSGKSGDVAYMRYGELLNEDGTLNPMTSVAGQIKGPNKQSPCQPDIAVQRDNLTLSGQTGGDDWTPSWSWHGFRYIEVIVPAGVELTPDSVECYPMRTDVDLVSNFSSSDPFLQDIRTLNRNTFDSNMMSVQSDCPHRERFGYGGDPLGCGEAGLSIYDWSTFYRKRVHDFNDAQRMDANGTLTGFPETSPYVGIKGGSLGPGTGPIGWETYQPVTQLWLYKYYGDTQTMVDSFESTYAYIKLLDTNPPGVGGGLGDWMPVENTKVAFTGLIFKRMSYLAFANITEILDKHDLADEYRKKALAIDTAVNAQFLDEMTGAYTVLQGASLHNVTQCGQGAALFMDIVPAALREKTLELMAGNARNASFIHGACQGGSFPTTCKNATGGPGPHMTAGLFGIKWFLMSLADGGMNDLAYDVLTTDTYPSFKWMMNNQFANATTMWESWFFSDNTFSHNHPMFGSSEVWLLQSVGGIQPHPSAKGMDRVLIKPSPPTQLQHASASFDTPRGAISVSWARSNGGDGFQLKVTIPPNVFATVHVPSKPGTSVMEGNQVLDGGRRTLGGAQIFEVGSGEYIFDSVVSVDSPSLLV